RLVSVPAAVIRHVKAKLPVIGAVNAQYFSTPRDVRHELEVGATRVLVLIQIWVEVMVAEVKPALKMRQVIVPPTPPLVAFPPYTGPEARVAACAPPATPTRAASKAIITRIDKCLLTELSPFGRCCRFPVAEFVCRSMSFRRLLVTINPKITEINVKM